MSGIGNFDRCLDPLTPIDAERLGPSQRGARVAVTHSLVSAEVLGTEIEQAYALGAPLECRLLRRGSNDTYLLSAGDGHYIARLYGAGRRSLPEISYELDLLSHLGGRGLSVPLPLAARDGRLARLLLAPEGMRALVVLTHLAGEPLDWNREDHCYLSGRAAATIHAASEDFVSRHARFRIDLEYLIDASLAALEPVLARQSDNWSYLLGWAGRLRVRLAATGTDLEWGVCHGDLGDRNIHLAPDGRLGVLDFDCCGPGWRASDFAEIYAVADFLEMPALWEAFVRGYREVRSIEAADLAAAPLFQAARQLWMLGRSAANTARWGVWHLRDEILDHYWRFFRRWEAQHPS